MENLTTGELAILIERHPNTIRAWANTGTLKCYRDRAGNRRFSLEDVLRFQKDRQEFEGQGRDLGTKLFNLKRRSGT